MYRLYSITKRSSIGRILCRHFVCSYVLQAFRPFAKKEFIPLFNAIGDALLTLGLICKNVYQVNYSLKFYKIMAMFQITTKNRKQVNGIRIEPGMTVQVVSQSMSNPVITNGGQSVIDAFYRIYGIDIKKAGCLNMVDLKVDKIG